MNILCDEDARRAVVSAVDEGLLHLLAIKEDEGDDEDALEYSAGIASEWKKLCDALGDSQAAKSAADVAYELEQAYMEVQARREEEETEEGEDSEPDEQRSE